EMTIRRDLNHKSAPVVLLGGYIVLEPRSASHYLLSDQKSRLVPRDSIAQKLPRLPPRTSRYICCQPLPPRWLNVPSVQNGFNVT
ncbi:hypothetical protein MJM28_27705, partial [Salmonella enterica subsp. enterica serovar Montevideo]|nr:hypothetical protein [Salmonella enterica subsp. enterica serovar Montevideo]